MTNFKELLTGIANAKRSFEAITESLYEGDVGEADASAKRSIIALSVLLHNAGVES